MKKCKEVKKYWMDENENRWSADSCSKKEAKKRSEHMIDCHFCQDCAACENCWGCESCISCKGCEHCLRLTYCIDCYLCEQVHGYKNLAWQKGLRYHYKTNKITKREEKELLNINYKKGETND